MSYTEFFIELSISVASPSVSQCDLPTTVTTSTWSQERWPCLSWYVAFPLFVFPVPPIRFLINFPPPCSSAYTSSPRAAHMRSLGPRSLSTPFLPDPCYSLYLSVLQIRDQRCIYPVYIYNIRLSVHYYQNLNLVSIHHFSMSCQQK